MLSPLIGVTNKGASKKILTKWCYPRLMMNILFGVQRWASPQVSLQVRNYGLIKIIADLQTFVVKIADLRLRSIFYFIPQLS